MESAEQRACIEDIRGFLANVTILVQQEGETRRHGDVDRLPVKYLYLLAGPEAAMRTIGDTLLTILGASFDNVALRINPIIDRRFSVDPNVSAGGQVVDAVLEIWLPRGADDTFTPRVLNERSDVDVVGAFQVDELILKDHPVEQ